MFSLNTYAQENSFEFYTDFGFFNSSINGKLLSNSYGFLDNNDKNNIINSLQTKNNIALESNHSLAYNNKKGWGLVLSNNIGVYATYPKSLVQLTLLGNQSFKGESLKLTPLNLTAYHYSQIDFSYQWSKKINTSIGLLFGHQLATIKVNTANFFTESNAAYINYDLGIESHFSDTSDIQNNIFKNNGFGVAFGISYSDKIRKGSYNIALSDIGFISWNEKTTNAIIESQFQFEGINVDDFIAFNDSLIENEFNDTQEDLKKSNVASHTWQLPNRLNISFKHPIVSSIVQAYSLSFEHRISLYTNPKLTAQIHKTLKKQHTFSIGYHTGGFEPNSFQFNYYFKSEGTHFQIYSRQVNSLIQDYNYGLQLGFGIKRVFSNGK